MIFYVADTSFLDLLFLIAHFNLFLNLYIFKVIFSQNNCYKLFHYMLNTKDHKFKSYVKSKVKTNLNILTIQINTSVFKNRLPQL